VSTSDVTVDALFRQAGVIRTDTLSELFGVAKLLVSQPVPRGSRVGIVTNAGGLGILCADACEGAGLTVPELPAAVRDDLASFLAPSAATANPVDMIATAPADHYRRAVGAVAGSGAVDAIIALFIPPLVTRADDVADALMRAADTLGRELPMLAVFASQEQPAQLAEPGGPAVFTYPEEAAGALARAARYGGWLQRDPGEAASFPGVRPAEAAATIARALERGGGWLEFAESAQVLTSYGVAQPRWRIVGTPEEVGRAARAIGGPVAVKAIAPGLLHKTEAGAVRAGLAGRATATSAARDIEAAVADAGLRLDGFLVQGMAPPGTELLVGMVLDPVFGPVFACGAGGTTAEVAGDVEVRLAPLTARDADEMLRALRAYPLLTGFRGAPPADLDALAEVILRVAALVSAHEEIVELDLNPVLASPEGAVVVDVRMRVQPIPPRRPWPALEA
jgi:acyl-CoA synthetase (NDP forming)